MKNMIIIPGSLWALNCKKAYPDINLRQNNDWYDAAMDMQSRWKVPIPVAMAMMYQESGYRYDAKPPMDYFLFIPIGRKSSAYGYAQVKDETWDDYKDQTGNGWADRDDFEDAIHVWVAQTGFQGDAVAGRIGIREHIYRIGPARNNFV